METVRDSQLVWPYCSECGCRLSQAQIGNTVILMHFPHHYSYSGKDARDHECTQWNLEWSAHASKVYGAPVYVSPDIY